jgi:uncharacterized OsmC-like protein
MLDEIRSEIRLEGDLEGAQREQLLKIAARCPVYRTLLQKSKFGRSCSNFSE